MKKKTTRTEGSNSRLKELLQFIWPVLCRLKIKPAEVWSACSGLLSPPRRRGTNHPRKKEK
jgi:hypothetical protein